VARRVHQGRRRFALCVSRASSRIFSKPRGGRIRESSLTRFHGRREIEGGLCVRRVEPFITESERRYFVLEGKAFSADGQTAPDLVQQVAARIPSPFFSVDVIRRKDGMLRVVEVGDGQVSDLVGWSPAAFVAMWTTVRPAV
jgi:hypothetical protein